MKSTLDNSTITWYSNSRGVCKGRKFWIMQDGQIILKSLTTGNYVKSDWDTNNRNRYFKIIRNSLRQRRIQAYSSWTVVREETGFYRVASPYGTELRFTSVQNYLTWSDWMSAERIHNLF